MASGGAFGGARGYQPRAPEKGVFPLDHFGECTKVKEAYMHCLKQHQQDTESCQHLAKRYLECRMDRNLMAKQDLKDLGFSETDSNTPRAPSQQQVEDDRRSAGFIAGTNRHK